MTKKILIALMVFITIFGVAACKKDGNKLEIIIDGGGVSGNYNTTTDYNQLQKLADEWNKASSKYQIKINRNSLNGNRDSILAYASTSTGPDVIYQTGTTIVEDMEQGYFVDVTDYLNAPNKYVPGNVKWSDLYGNEELEATRAPNGNFYSIGIDKNVAGIVYNKDILTAAGATLPIDTYGQFIEAQRKVSQYFSSNNLTGYKVYGVVDHWYDIVIEGGVYSKILDDVDTIRPNKIVDAEELCKAATTIKDGKYLYQIKNGNNVDARFEAYMNLIKNSRQFSDATDKGDDMTRDFIQGKVAFLSCLGRSMTQVQRATKTFEVGAFGYPYLTQQDVNTYGKVGVEIDEVGVRRGVSGIGTGWWVTKASMKKGTVEAAVDFLQFVTAPENNRALVNNRGNAIPLDLYVDSTNPSSVMFTTLANQYNIDTENNFNVWHVFNVPGILGFDYWSKFEVERGNWYSGSNILTVANSLKTQFDISVSNFIAKNGSTGSGAWDTANW